MFHGADANPDNRIGGGSRGQPAPVAAQSFLGLLPQRRNRLDRGYFADSLSTGPFVKTGFALFQEFTVNGGSCVEK